MASRSSARGRGSVTLATIVVGLAVAVGLFVGSVVVAYVMAAHQARSISDLAALSVATSAASQLGDESACAAGSGVAQQSGARLTDCEIVRAQDEVAVRVEVTIGVPWAVPGLPAEVNSQSFAGNPRSD